MSRDYHTRSRDHKADIMASAELSLLEAELTTALEQCIGAHFEESESRLDVKRTRCIYGRFGFQQRQLSRRHDVSFMIT